MADIRHQPLQGFKARLVFLEGSMDVGTAMAMEETARAMIREGSMHLVFDLGKLSYMNTKGLGVLLALQKTLDAWDGRVLVVGAHGRVLNSIEITGLNRVIRLYSQLDDALAALPNE